jgi:hypothetical protein
LTITSTSYTTLLNATSYLCSKMPVKIFNCQRSI